MYKIVKSTKESPKSCFECLNNDYLIQLDIDDYNNYIYLCICCLQKMEKDLTKSILENAPISS